MSDHSHGPLICSECKKIARPCVCLPLGKTEEYYECPSCRSDKALRLMEETKQFNEKLKELGVLHETESK
jgi:hypothetical protein